MGKLGVFSSIIAVGVVMVACQETRQSSSPPWLDAAHSQADQSVVMEIDERVGQDSDVPDMSVGLPCEYPAECPEGDCISGRCRMEMPQSCRRDEPCPDGESCDVYGFCVLPCEADRSCPMRPRPCRGDCPRHMTCYDGRCVNECVTDDQCGEGHCMKGVCEGRPQLLSSDIAQPMAPVGGLVAGVGVWPLNYPLGVSMAGFIGRQGPMTPYAKALGGSDRILERQDVRALVLSTDEALLIVLRFPLAWSTDYLKTLTAMKLQALTVSDEHPDGINYLDSIVTVATHSHSQPGRFWHILPELGLGTFGYGTFSFEMVNRYADSAAHAIKAALDDVRLARFGWSILDDIDPEGHIHSNRRPGGFEVVDHRMMVWRIEDLDGEPMAGLVNLAIHGTHVHDTMITADVAGAIEHSISQHLIARGRAEIPILFANGNAGNVAPRGDDIVAHPSTGKIQVVGERVAQRFLDAWESATPESLVNLEVVNRRVPITYELLGYDAASSEFRDAQGQVYQYGGYFCLDGDEPSGGWQDGALLCKAQIDLLGWPVPNVHKAPLTVLRIDRLVVTTLPGEPTSSLGLRLAEEVERDALDMGGMDVRSMNFGYSQGHHLYLMEPDDWWEGGYEAGNNWFGWRLGSYLVAESRSLARQLWTPERETNDTGIKPTWWPRLVDDRVVATASVESPKIIEGPVTSVQRGQLLHWTWHGGHPGIDLPRVRIKAFSGEREWLMGDDRGFDSVLSYRGNYNDDHRWSFAWEVPFDEPVDSVAIMVMGHFLDGGTEDALAYEIVSQRRTIDPAQLILTNPHLRDDQFIGHLNWPDGPSNNDGVSPFESLQPLGTQWRHGDLDVPRSARDFSFILGGPAGLEGVRIHFYGADGLISTAEVSTELTTLTRALVVARSVEGDERTSRVNDWPTSRFNMTRPSGATEAVIEDVYGNFVRIPFATLESD